MKKRIICFVLAMSALAGATLYAQPGDTSDPLVSKSYVDARINDVLSMFGMSEPETPVMPEEQNIDAITRQVLEQLEYIIGSGNSTFVAVNAKKGQIIYGSDSCEIILRSGSCTVRLGGENGITDLTKGVDLGNGASVESNHHLIVPRNDGRGLFITSDEAWFLIRGEYIVI